MSSALPTVKILIVDDHPLMRQGLALRISTQPDLQVCGEAASEDEALKLVGQTTPDLAIIDIALKTGHGIELIKRIKARHRQVKMLVVSGFHDSLYAERALRAGALGYLNKQESNEKLIEAIRDVMAGHRFVSAEINRRLLDRALGGETPQSPIESLTDRELEIFRMIGQGMATGAIATALFLSPNTIDTHREKIKRKLSLATAGELTRAAVQWVLENSS
jgi:DNA-binding NarL/FixJ family response regulator